jgi:shikimate dehydrogenase
MLINATSHGHEGDAPPLSPGWFLPGGLCYDLNYGRAAYPLQAACAAAGIAYSDGLGMLVHQAALSFHLWTGRLPAVAPVIEGLRRNTQGPFGPPDG